MMMVIAFIAVQLIIALAVLFVLKRLLERELERAAIEQLSAIKSVQGASGIKVYHGGALSAELRDRLMRTIKGRFASVHVDFEHVPSLKGGLMIKLADEVLDFSVSSRLEYLWS